MPLFELRTNRTLGEEEGLILASELSGVCAEILNKPESYVMVNLQANQSLIFAGNCDPTAFGELHSINLPDDETSSLSATLCTFLSERLNISKDRIYLSFVNVDRNNWGWNGKTF
tara:strand:+ start:206 stop:550 length:345 start_codon:yes stop_codon:yes gene_type:complete